jgi:hypothetical protein
MKIINVIKRLQSNNQNYYSYELIFDSGDSIHLGLSLYKEIWIVFSEDTVKIDVLRKFYYEMLQNRNCKERLKFAMINPKDMIFMPSEMNQIQERLLRDKVRACKSPR